MPAPRSVIAAVPFFVAVLVSSGCGGTVVFEEPGSGGSGSGDGDASTARASSGSDSTGTGSDGCPSNTLYTCDEGETCITQDQICDDVLDCVEGTDEFECSSSCSDEGFACNDGSCIPLERLCDREADCSSGEDESPDACGFVDCGPGDLPCRDGACIPDVFVCDGASDCSQGEDETSNVCNGFVCGYPEIATEDPPFAYCLTHYCCSVFDQCVAGGIEACVACLDSGGDACIPVLDCIVDHCSD